jgi:radical SAM superfamily enzyme YgiQ (UPF0313 family)
MKDEIIDILFLDGLNSGREGEKSSFLGFIFPIGSLLSKNSYNYKILNMRVLNNYTSKSLKSELQSIRFKVIGISTHAENIALVYKIVNLIKEEFPIIPIILGGPQATFSYQTIFQSCKCDIIVHHEGEYKLIKILDHYIKGIGYINDIPGISFRDSNGEIISNQDDGFVNIDALPVPDYTILTDHKFWHIPKYCSAQNFSQFLKMIKSTNNIYTSSRGCPYQCIFCVEGNIKQKHRVRSIENVYRDIKAYLEQSKQKVIIFSDDTFTSSKERVLEMCSILTELRKSFDFIWFAEGRVNVLAKHPELLKIMSDAGMWRLQVGIESGSQKILDAQNKFITKEQLRRVFYEIGKIETIDIVGNLIFGSPKETKETLLETIEFVKELYSLANFRTDITHTYLVPFAGTPIRNNPEKYDLEILDENFELNMLQFSEIICLPKDLQYQELQNYYIQYNKETSSYIKENIFKLKKNIIDRRILSDRKYSRTYYPTILYSWTYTFYSMPLLTRYYTLFERECILKNIDDLNENYVPIRLWNINYNLKSNCYSFETFIREKIIIKGKEKYLWEMANGIYSIMEILTHDNSPFELNEESKKEAIEFYKILFNSFALVFSEY